MTSYVHGTLPYWNDVMKHPNYDQFWRKEAWVNQLHSSTVPNLNVAGFWDQEDPWGPWQIFRHAQQHDPDNTNFMVAGPWYHGGWAAKAGDSIGPVPSGATRPRSSSGKTSKPRSFVITFMAGQQAGVEGHHLPIRIEHLAHLRRLATEAIEADQPLSARRRNPVVLRPRGGRTGVSPIHLGSGQPGALPCAAHLAHLPVPEWRFWEVADQRFVDHRPDVLTFVSDPLDHDVVITGEIAATLFASTSGTDSDFIVKLIDVYPENGQKSAIDAEQPTPPMRTP